MQTTDADGAALSAEFTSACSARHRMITSQCFVKWDGYNWTNETDNLISHSGAYNLRPPGDSDLLAAGDVGQATVVLRNSGWRYSELSYLGDATLRTVIGGSNKLRGVEVKINQGFYTDGTPAAPTDAEYVQIFHGVIYDWDEDSARKTMTLQLRDLGQKYLQQRANTTVQENQRIDEWIDAMADAAGIPAGDRSLDVAIYTVPYTWLADESPIEEIWDAAQADGGRVYFDHHGQLVYENAVHWLDHTASVWTLDAGDFDNLIPDPDTDTLASEVQATWSPREIVASTTVYKLDEKKIIRPGETLHFDIKFSRPVTHLFELTEEVDYQFINGAGANMNSDCTLEIPAATRHAQRAEVVIANGHAHYSAMLIYLQLQGTFLVGSASQELTIPVNPAPVDFTLTRWLRGNTMIQTDSHARALATQLAENTCATIRRIWQLRGVRGIPQIELGDRITFHDARQVGGQRDGLVVGMAWAANESGGYTQDLQLVDATDLFPYADYFTIGSDTLGNHERCYY